DLALTHGHAELETVGNPPGTVDEMRRRHGRAQLVGSRLEDRDPAVEMLGRDGKLEVRLHWLAMIAAGHQRDRRPERAELQHMRFPILDPRREYRPDQRIGLHASIEGPDQALDHGVIDSGLVHEIARDAGAALRGAFGIVYDSHG